MTEQPQTHAPDDRLLTPAEVADLFRITTKALARWADAGFLDAVRLPGRHRRYREAEVRLRLETGWPQ